MKINDLQKMLEHIKQIMTLIGVDSNDTEVTVPDPVHVARGGFITGFAVLEDGTKIRVSCAPGDLNASK